MKQAHVFAALSFALAAPMGTYAHSGSQWCIDLSGDIDFYYQLQPPWGLSSAKGPYHGCFDDSASRGAIFIGTEAKPQSGNTKLECAFNAYQPNCDISLIDGYSVSVACTAPGGQTFGSDIDLWSQGTCPDVVGSTCRNVNSFAAARSDVASFFKPAHPHYRIFASYSDNPVLKEVGTIKCTVSGGKPGGKKEKRDSEADVHKARAHPRGLRDIVGALNV